MKQKFHFSILSITLFSLVFSGFSSAPPAFATDGGTVDQENVFHDGFGFPIFFGTGQGFTTSFNNLVDVENITAVDVSLDGTCGTLAEPETLFISIHEFDISGPTVIGPIPYVVDPLVTLQHIVLPKTTLSTETLYAIKLQGTGACFWMVSVTDTYLGGDAFLGGSTEFDFVFKTYFDAAPPDEICDDGIDNDLDGLIDEADPDCATPPTDEKKSCEALTKENPGKDKGKEKAKENNKCS